jgi:hypothetical protein
MVEDCPLPTNSRLHHTQAFGTMKANNANHEHKIPTITTLLYKRKQACEIFIVFKLLGQESADKS